MRLTAKYTNLLISLCLMALGLVVCAAWWLEITVLMQILPRAAPMQFNTALLFLLMGCGLFAARFGATGVVRVLAVCVGVFALLTLSQYLTAINLGIDQLFIHGYLQTQTSHPGRMAPNSAAAFILSAAALYLVADQRRQLLAASFSTLVLALGLMSLIGYGLDISTAYGWGQLTRMAIHTSVAFVLLGAGILIVAGSSTRAAAFAELPWFAMSAVLLVASLSLLTWLALNSEHNKQQQGLLELEAQAIAERLSERARNRLQTIERMATRYAAGLYETPEEWDMDAVAYLRDMPSVDLLLVVDDEGKVLARYARDTEAGRRSTPPLSLLRGVEKAGAIIQAPSGPWIVSGRRETGIKESRILAHIAPEPLAEYEMRRPNAKGYLISIIGPAQAANADDPRTEPFAEADMQWPAEAYKVRVWRAPDNSGRYFRLPDLLLVGGLGIALLLSLAIAQYQRLRQMHRAIAETNASLELRTQSLVAANESLKQFSHAVSHDLKAPVRTMINFAQLIQKSDAGTSIDSVRDLLQEIVQAGKGLYGMVDSLLAVSRVGHVNPAAIRHVDMRGVVDDVLARLAMQVSDHGVQVEIGSLPTLDTEPNLMGLVIQNLVANAIKYQPGPRPYVGIFASEDARGWVFSVVDHGPGIDPRHHKDIFRLFNRGEAADEEGHGVGLATAQRIINALGGRIWVESKPGQGACFRFFHPLKPLLLNSEGG